MRAAVVVALVTASSLAHADDKRAVVSEHAAIARARCLSLVLERYKSELPLSMAGKTPSPDVAKERARLGQGWSARYAAAKKAGVLEACAKSERALFDAPFGGWTQQNLIDASWQAESLAMVAWALGAQDKLPAWDQQLSDSDVLKRLDGKLTRRSADEIKRARDVAELWHWRARTMQLDRAHKPIPELPPGMTLKEAVARAAALAEKEGLFQAKDGDFPAFGKPYRNLSNAEWLKAVDIVQERHKALNWLCGYASDWDAVPTDT